MTKIKVRKKKGKLAFYISSSHSKQEWMDTEGEFYIELVKPGASEAQKWYWENEIISPYRKEVQKQTGELYTDAELEKIMLGNIGLEDESFPVDDKAKAAKVISLSLEWMGRFFDYFTGAGRKPAEITAAIQRLELRQMEYLLNNQKTAANICRIRAELVKGNSLKDSLCSLSTEAEKEEMEIRCAIAIDYRNGVVEMSKLLEV